MGMLRGVGFGAYAVSSSKSWRLMAGQLSGDSSGATPSPQPKEHLLFGGRRPGGRNPLGHEQCFEGGCPVPLPTVG